ncbi:MAG: hypothetical protein A2Y40_07225 [Candidatus Margulisbacteria bacterium GWF2_35_9]|nr:MAG: hypothetical protein A2Y40_07225 [Candidatus Margulisbacteria bacterium GWF2_35_9]
MNNTILVIDDEFIIKESVFDALEDEKYHFIYAENGEIGFQKYIEYNPVVVLLDLRMPILDGFGFLDKIKVMPYDLSSIVVLTGHGSDNEIEKCFSLGVSSFLKKPFNIFELRGLVRNLVDLNNTKRQVQTSCVVQSIISSILQLAISETQSNKRLKDILEFIIDLPIIEGVMQKGAIYIIDDTNGKMVLRESSGISSDLLTFCENISSDTCFCGEQIMNKVEHDRNKDILVPSHYCIPMKTNDTMIGLMVLFLEDNYVKKSEDYQIISEIASIVAIIVRNKA